MCLKGSGFTYKEIAGLVKLSEANVRQIFNRAKKTVRNKVTGDPK